MTTLGSLAAAAPDLTWLAATRPNCSCSIRRWTIPKAAICSGSGRASAIGSKADVPIRSGNDKLYGADSAGISCQRDPAERKGQSHSDQIEVIEVEE